MPALLPVEGDLAEGRTKRVQKGCANYTLSVQWRRTGGGLEAVGGEQGKL
jgi:hypothetical protein